MTRVPDIKSFTSLKYGKRSYRPPPFRGFKIQQALAQTETLEAGAMSGAILETWIMAELLKGYWHNGRQAPFYYYRDKDKKEIDLLIVQDGTAYPLEFKKSASPGKDDARHFQVLKKLKMPVGPGGVICLSERSLPLWSTVQSIPVSIL